jgi:hypothetical protein
MMQNTQDIKYCSGTLRLVRVFCGHCLCDRSFSNGWWDDLTGEPLRSMAVLKEIDWATSNCPLSWELQGAWPGCGKGLGEGIPPYALPGRCPCSLESSRLQSLALSLHVGLLSAGGPLDKGLAPSLVSAIDAKKYAERYLEVRTSARSGGGDTIAAGDEYGIVRLARYPGVHVVRIPS